LASWQPADQQNVRPLCLLVIAGVPLLAADPPANPYERMYAAMQASIEKQKASVQVQAQTARPAAPPTGSMFFTTPWPALPLPTVAAADCDALPAARLDPLIDASAKRHGVKPELVRAVIQQESGGRPCAVSVKGAQGLMQLMPNTADELHVVDPFDPAQNVDAGTRFLKALLERFKGDLTSALGAYNAGPNAIGKDGRLPAIAETQDYVSEILKNLKSDSGRPSAIETSAKTSRQ
jgi:soluble lytic murein transglycosylase-like protein